jgi:hypothetical protein
VSVETHADLLEAIDEKIEKINNHKAVRIAEQLMRQRDELQMARRALLGVGSKTTSSGGPRAPQGEVVQWFLQNPSDEGYSVAYISEAMGYPEATIRGHLNRGNNERFEKYEGTGLWNLRDPEGDDGSDEG